MNESEWSRSSRLRFGCKISLRIQNRFEVTITYLKNIRNDSNWPDVWTID